MLQLETKKEELIGFSAENYASRRINEHYMFNAILNEDGEKLFSEEDFEDLDESTLIDFIGIYNVSTKKFNA